MIYLMQAQGNTYLLRSRGVFYQDTTAQIGTRSNDVFIAWTQPGTVQVEYRTRHRLAYTGQDVEEYDTWSSWTQLYTTTTAYNLLTESGSQYSYYATKLPHTSTDVTGTYDQIIYQIRVRTCDSSGTNTKPWETSPEMPIGYYPEWSISSLDLDLETMTGDLQVAPYGLDGNNDPVIARPLSMFRLVNIELADGTDVYTQAMNRGEIDSFSYDSNGYIHLNIPAEEIALMPQSGAKLTCTLRTSDNISDNQQKTYTITIPSSSTHLKAPVATETETSTGLGVTVTHQTASGTYVAYEGVEVAYSWTDARGKVTTGNITLEQDVDWIGEIPSPPFGATVTLNITAKGTYNGYTIYNQDTDTHSMSSSRWFVLSHNQDIVSLGYELSLSRSVSNDVSITQLASGRNISRHGAGGSDKLNLSGTILDSARRGSISSIWLPDAEKLGESHDWNLRTPEGELYKVAVGSWSLNATRTGIENLSIDMEEVG